MGWPIAGILYKYFQFFYWTKTAKQINKLLFFQIALRSLYFVLHKNTWRVLFGQYLLLNYGRSMNTFQLFSLKYHK